MRLFIVVAVLLINCAPPPAIPYTVEQPVSISPTASLQWFADGAVKTLTVRNPLPYAVRAVVVCDPDDRWIVNVPAKGEVRGLIVEMVKDGYVNVCHVNEWHSAR